MNVKLYASSKIDLKSNQYYTWNTLYLEFLWGGKVLTMALIKPFYFIDYNLEIEEY